jgi:type IV pilus assembly protein PilP
MTRTFLIAAAAVAVLSLSGCSDGMDQLRGQVAEIKARPGEAIEPLPEIKPYEAFAYNASNLRSPFVPTAPARNDLAAGLRPDVKRPREFLEQFPLDTMRMVGTLQLQGRSYGLVQGKDGLVGISPTKITVIEIVPDGLGGYIERPAALALTE